MALMATLCITQQETALYVMAPMAWTIWSPGSCVVWEEFLRKKINLKQSADAVWEQLEQQRFPRRITWPGLTPLDSAAVVSGLGLVFLGMKPGDVTLPSIPEPLFGAFLAIPLQWMNRARALIRLAAFEAKRAKDVEPGRIDALLDECRWWGRLKKQRVALYLSDGGRHY